MDGKKSFLIFKDTLSVADDLDDEQLGRLFRAIINYQLGRDQEMDFVTKLAFNSFKSQFDRDNEKWEQKAELNRINGKKGGRPKKPTETQDNPENPDGYLKTQNNHDGLLETQNNPEKPVTVTVTVTDTVKGTGTVTDTVTGSETGSDTKTHTPHPPQGGQDEFFEDEAPKGKAKAKKPRTQPVVKPEGVSDEEWEEFKAIKKEKKQRLSAISLKTLENYAHDYGISLAECIKICVKEGWGTFKPEYMDRKVVGFGQRKGPKTIDDFMRENEESAARVLASGLLDDLP